MKPIIESFEPFKDEYFCAGNKQYCQKKILEIAKKYKPFKLPLRHIDTCITVWRHVADINSFAWHMKRSIHANLKYPIIMDNQGTIINGWHRMAKALATDQKYILCIRLEEPLPAAEIKKKV
jgi:hypothetical protein